MLPLVLNPVALRTGLAGRGAERDRRAGLLAEAGVEARLLPDTVSDALSAKVVSLPMHPYLDEATQDRIIAAVLASVG